MEIRLNQTMIALAFGGLIAFSPPSSALVNGGFETNSFTNFGTVIGPPLVPGIWAVENATRVGVEGLITPPEISFMLRMESDGLVATQAGQVQAAGAGAYTLSAQLTSGASLGSSNLAGVKAGMSLTFYSTINGGTPTTVSSPVLLLDGTASNWETFSFTGTAPAGTAYILAQVYFDNSTLIGNGAAGYVDDVRFAPIPEPATVVMFSIGLAGLLLARRTAG